MNIKAILLGLFVFAFAATAQAQTSPVNTKRQMLQKKRIAHGKKTRAISHREACKLHRQQRKITIGKRMAKADGKVSRIERKKIAKKQRKASRNIFRAKHNKVKRNG